MPTIEIIHDPSPILRKDQDTIRALKKGMSNEVVYLVRNLIDTSLLADIRRYLVRIGTSSLPYYSSIDMGAPNFHRINDEDERAYVRGCFHQFSFFPWNQDVFSLFRWSRTAFAAKNILSDREPDAFLGRVPQDGCIARLSFQFYPKGRGHMNMHSDPVDYHQYTNPFMLLSKKGRDFTEGGSYVEGSDGKRTFIEDVSEVGDVVFFYSGLKHGVSRIDPESHTPWLAFEGRWSLLFAVNKLHSNTAISNAKDLE